MVELKAQFRLGGRAKSPVQTGEEYVFFERKSTSHPRALLLFEINDDELLSFVTFLEGQLKLKNEYPLLLFSSSFSYDLID